MIEEIWIKLSTDLLKNSKISEIIDEIVLDKKENNGKIEEHLYSLKVDICEKKDKGYLRDKKMNNIKANLRQSSNYMIQLFYMTGQKYTCTRTKIGKLLSILAFKRARKNDKLFSEIIYKYDDCGTSINELKMYVNREAYMQLCYTDDEKYISTSLDHSVYIPPFYQDIDEISNELKEEIEEVFRNFGSYSRTQLGKMLYDIVVCDGVTDEFDTINLEKIRDLKIEDIEEKITENKLIQYIFENK